MAFKRSRVRTPSAPLDARAAVTTSYSGPSVYNRILGKGVREREEKTSEGTRRRNPRGMSSQRVRERAHCRRQRAIPERVWVNGRTGRIKHPPPGALANAAGLASGSLTWPGWVSLLLAFFCWLFFLLSHLLFL